jgi:superoxide dismutase
MANKYMKNFFKIISHQGNTNQNYIEILTAENAGKDMQKKELSCILLVRIWNINWYSHYGNLYGASSEN